MKQWRKVAEGFRNWLADGAPDPDCYLYRGSVRRPPGSARFVSLAWRWWDKMISEVREEWEDLDTAEKWEFFREKVGVPSDNIKIPLKVLDHNYEKFEIRKDTDRDRYEPYTVVIWDEHPEVPAYGATVREATAKAIYIFERLKERGFFDGE